MYGTPLLPRINNKQTMLSRRRVLRRPCRTHQVRGLLWQVPDPVAAVPVLIQVHSQPQQHAWRQYRQQYDEESVARLTAVLVITCPLSNNAIIIVFLKFFL